MTAQCSIALPDVEVSDTTEDDSSNAVKYINHSSFQTIERALNQRFKLSTIPIKKLPVPEASQ